MSPNFIFDDGWRVAGLGPFPSFGQAWSAYEGYKMTPQDFAAWVAMMKAERKWSARRCSRELGCAVNQIAIWSAKGAPPYIGLACAALAFGLPAWKAV